MARSSNPAVRRRSTSDARIEPGVRVSFSAYSSIARSTAVSCAATRLVLERTQEVEQILLLTLCEIFDAIDHTVGLRPGARMLTDRLEQICRPPIVQEENALAEAPQRRTPELIETRVPRRDAVRQFPAHVMDEQIREEVGVDLAQAGGHRGSGRLQLR